jgi:hypothetical protein
MEILGWLFDSKYAKAHTIDGFSYLLRTRKKKYQFEGKKKARPPFHAAN